MISIFTCLVFVSVIQYVASVSCESGSWQKIPAAKDPLPAVYARNGYRPNDTALSEKEFLLNACQTQVLFYTCYYHEGHPDYTIPKGRAFELEYTRFQPKDMQCLSPRPADMLSILRDRRLLFLGDSVMIQIFLDFICKLSSSVDTTVDMHYAAMATAKSIGCPFGKKHCHPYDGFVRIPSFRTEVYGRRIEYSKGRLKAIFRSIFNLTSNDIVVFNVGLHYNNENLYRKDLLDIFSELTEFQQELNMPTVFLMESTPQHFNTSNGYFDQSVAEKSTGCSLLGLKEKDFENQEVIKKIASLDYRNIALNSIYNDIFGEKVVYGTKIPRGYSVPINNSTFMNDEMNNSVLSTFAKNLTLMNPVVLVRTARALYSRVDAHIGLSPFFYFKYPDCTHWCTPNGVFAYIHQCLYNAWLDAFNVRSQRTASIRHFPDNILVKGSGKSIYFLYQDKRYGFSGFDHFTSRGFDFDHVITLQDFDLEGIPYMGLLPKGFPPRKEVNNTVTVSNVG